MQLNEAVIQVSGNLNLDLFCSSRIKSKRIDGKLEEIAKIAREEKVSQLAIFPENQEISRFTLLIGTQREKTDYTKILLENGQKVILNREDEVEHIVILSKENKIYQFAVPAEAI